MTTKAQYSTVCKWLFHSSFFFFFLLFHNMLFMCALRCRQFLSVQGFGVFWKEWLGWEKCPAEPEVWKWRWSPSGAALCSWRARTAEELCLIYISCTCLWRWWSSNCCLLLTVTSSAIRGWIMASNTSSAVKTGRYQVQKDLGLRLFQDVLNVSRGVCINKLYMLIGLSC